MTQRHPCLHPFLRLQPEQTKHPYNHISFHFPLSLSSFHFPLSTFHFPLSTLFTIEREYSSPFEPPFQTVANVDGTNAGRGASIEYIARLQREEL